MMLAGILLAASVVTLPPNGNCGDLSNGLAELKTKFNETPVWEGWIGGNEVILTMSPDRAPGETGNGHPVPHRTWTMVVTAGSHSCELMDGGDGHLSGTLDSKTD